jgi:hypothetical protein
VGYEPARGRRYHAQTLRPIDDGDVSVRRHPACDVEETAGPSDQHQFRQFRTAAAGPGNRAGDRRKNPADAQVVWRFKSVDDLLAIRGIGPKRLEKMRKYLVAGKSPGTAPKTPAANSAVPTKCPGCTKAAPSKPATLPVPLKALPKKPAEGEAQLQAKMKSQIECAGGVSCGYRATYPLQSAQTMGHPG